MPPPATPSPHRFLTGQRKTQSTHKEPRPPSTLRNQLQQPASEASQHDSSDQFAHTPRFSHGSANAATQPQRPPSSPKSTLVQALRNSIRPTEDVEDAGYEDEDDEMLDVEPAPDLQVAVSEATHAQANQQWTNDLALSPKRRRLEPNETFASPGQLTTKERPPTASRLVTATDTPRFTHSFVHSTPSVSSDTATSHRPAFIRPPAQPSEPSEPVPEVFSPHRRGQKFIPGGMASTVQQWVLEAGQAAVRSRKGQAYLHGEDYVLRVKVEGEVGGDGPFTVRARQPNGDLVYLLLAGGRKGIVGQSDEICSESVVGVRAPTWEVEVEGKMWTVGVDWKVLS